MQKYFFRESDSDVAGGKELSSEKTSVPVQLSFTLSAGASLADIEDFFTPKTLPARASWPAGNYSITFQVDAAANITYELQAVRTDKLGAELTVLGTSSQEVGTTGTVSITIAGVAVPTAIETDRLKIKLRAQNDDVSNPSVLKVSASLSFIDTPLPFIQKRLQQNVYRRGTFLEKESESMKNALGGIDQEDGFIIESQTFF